VPREADVREGDLIVTSGLGDRFPGGYPVAVVTSIDREKGQTFARVEAAPLAALDRGREVLLISTPQPPIEPEAVPETPVGPSGQPEPGDGTVTPADGPPETGVGAPEPVESAGEQQP
jgi:rod shape-determining protein MreC